MGKQFLVVSFPYLDYLDFRTELKMKINDLIEIENIDTLCWCNFNEKTKYVWFQNFGVNQFYVWTDNWPSFSKHTATIKELAY